MTAQELLERLQLLDETERIEAKAGSDAHKLVMETICTFANEPGMGGAGLSSNPGGITSNSEALDSNLATRDDPLSDPRRQALLNELPGGLAARVGIIGRRHPPEEVNSLVVTLCQLRDWRTEALAAWLGRKAETVRKDYLRPLLRADRIGMTRPD